MKLIKAQFKNFRLLRDLEVEFSLEKDKKLTVIRAENETGKTTMLSALQWALYGDNALPNKGRDYRLHPIDWNQKNDNHVEISVSIDFENTTLRKTSSKFIEKSEKFRIVRNTTEIVDGIKWNRKPSTVYLYVITDKGANIIDHPDSFIDDLCPEVLREIFFIDGDRALNFIEEESVSTKRERVHKAIRSLLGLDVIEKALDHMNQVERDVNKKAQKIGSQSSTNISKQIEEITERIESKNKELKSAEEQFNRFDKEYHGIDKMINDALIQGNREQLVIEKEGLIKQIKNIDGILENAQKEHCNLFKSQVLSKDLLKPILSKAKAKLESLRDAGKIPNTTIPVLIDRLEQDTCFCGESIDRNDNQGLIRRNNIEQLMKESEKADEIQKIVTNLFFGSNETLTDSIIGENDWSSLYKKIVEERDKLSELRETEGKKLKGIESKIDKIPKKDLQGLRGQKKEFLRQRDKHFTNITLCRSELKNFESQKEVLNLELTGILKNEEKGARIIADLEVVNDIKHILQSSIDRLKDQELQKVSELMNKIFLKMIGADPEQQAIIKKTLISGEFDIIVYGPNDRTLNPDRDLNGASRRALTLAFILALTKVSEFEAPNIIDTPLGMMSGYVKRSVLRTAIQESTQLVLFLTRSEIAGCEEIIGKNAGSLITLSNTAHYPKMLKNDPKISEQKLIRCDCKQDQECKICERYQDSEAI